MFFSVSDKIKTTVKNHTAKSYTRLIFKLLIFITILPINIVKSLVVILWFSHLSEIFFYFGPIKEAFPIFSFTNKFEFNFQGFLTLNICTVFIYLYIYDLKVVYKTIIHK